MEDAGEGPSVPDRGSLRWIREFVNGRPGVLDRAIHEASGGRIETPIDWRSPLGGENHAEYRDGAFLNKLGVRLEKRSLDSFWPRRGPHWDALGLSAAGDPILVEAKANVPEIVSGPSRAGEVSSETIRKALAETATFLGASSTCDWSGTFYQYANRLAHLYLLRELNHVPAWLVFVYFIGDEDTQGPRTKAEWQAALEVLHGALGVRRSSLLGYKLDVFVRVDEGS